MNMMMNQQQQLQQSAHNQSSTINQEDELLTLSTLSGYEFTELFYNIFDTQRLEIGHFFKENSIIIWDGKKLSSLNMINQFFKELPSTKHNISSIDVHSISNEEYESKTVMIDRKLSLMVTVVGDVQYGFKASHRGFHHSFILENDYQALQLLQNNQQQQQEAEKLKNMYYIVSSNMRSSKALDKIEYY